MAAPSLELPSICCDAVALRNLLFNRHPQQQQVTAVVGQKQGVQNHRSASGLPSAASCHCSLLLGRQPQQQQVTASLSETKQDQEL